MPRCCGTTAASISFAVIAISATTSPRTARTRHPRRFRSRGNWAFPKGWETGISGAINWGDGKIYFFRGEEYLSYDMASDKVDAGYPRPIAGNWRGFPKSWSSGIDAAMNWGNGIVYFVKGDQYLRYDIKTGTSDASY